MEGFVPVLKKTNPLLGALFSWGELRRNQKKKGGKEEFKRNKNNHVENAQSNS